MKTINKKVIIDGEELEIVLDKYVGTDNTAMLLIDAAGLPYATVTVNIPDCSMPLKNY